MPHLITKVPLEEVLNNITQSSDGVFTVEFPGAACFGIGNVRDQRRLLTDANKVTVTQGGLVISAAQKAAIQHAAQESTTASHGHVLQMSANFFRPTLPSPKVTTLRLRTVNKSKATSDVPFV